jgi:hypothetical protein
LEPSKGHQIYNFPSATKQDVSPLTSKYWIHFKGHQAWNTLRATKHGTFHWPSNWGLPPPPSFPFSLKAWIGLFVFLFSNVIFNLNFCSYNFLWKEKND